MIKGVNEKFGPCNVKVLRVSDMARAKETADIIAKQLPTMDGGGGGGVERSLPDADLNEGRPAHHIPGGKARQSIIDRTDENHPRIEKAFQKYFYRADPPSEEQELPSSTTTTATEEEQSPDENTDTTTTTTLKPNPKHEFEIIVCHANVIRYFMCRALQLPPEAWLRLCIFNCSLNYVTIRPTGTVSCRLLGDIGHLGHEHSTFSMHHGFNW
uniref:Serine/threonine-protein phosphatase PGAM5, mitochondrial n=1 Tax=Ditylum brightwellii TaxID=49249 RepID=A0A7S4S1D9_9STRA|mmetsp:Transcript_34114/g.45174  ORF Transcript_34114/g.45174 Transcript_34114/m.45174 type:complete len:213 (-) Transcript_34114:247-885(-)